MLHCAYKAALYAIEMTLGNRIRAARKRLIPKLTQGAIGREFDISDKAVSSWERDETTPELTKLPTLARLLKVPLTWLLEGAGQPPAPDDPEVLMDRLLPAERATVRAVIQSLLSQRQAAA